MIIASKNAAIPTNINHQGKEAGLVKWAVTSVADATGIVVGFSFSELEGTPLQWSNS